MLNLQENQVISYQISVILDFLAGLTALSPGTGLSYIIAVLLQELIVFSFRLQVDCASMVYSDASATYGHLKISD